MMSQIKLVMSDIDGTILDDQHQIDELLPRVLSQLTERQIPFILASARSPKGMYPIAEKLGIANQPLVCYNGALILENGLAERHSPLFSHELNTREAQFIIEEVGKKFPQITLNLYSGEDWYTKSLDQWAKIEATITNEQPIVENLSQLLEKQQLPVHKLLLIGTPAEVKAVFEYCTALKLTTSAFYLSKENYLEVTHRDVSKERALTEIAAHFQVLLSDTLAIGDNFNDLPMLKLAGIGVAMGNAPVEVKAVADVLTADNQNNGVLLALEKFVLLGDN